ncbi:hypothetical protein Tco_1285897 [Tanacetum coccineum]
MEESLSKFMSESVKRPEENSNLIKEIRASTNATIRNHGALIKTLEIQIGQISKVLQERGFGSLPSSTKMNPRHHVKSILTTVEANITPIRPTHVDDFLSRKEKDPGSFNLPCYINNVCFENAIADLRASISVVPLSTYLNLGLGELAYTKLTVELADRTVKHPKGIAKNVLVGIVVENMDGYRDQDMGGVIFGEPFCKASCMEARRFDGLITIYNGNDNMTYQMARSHPRFKHLSNAQCNKIMPLLKVILYDDLAGKEIDNVGEVSIIWNSMCVVVMLVGYGHVAMNHDSPGISCTNRQEYLQV